MYSILAMLITMTSPVLDPEYTAYRETGGDPELPGLEEETVPLAEPRFRVTEDGFEMGRE